MGSLNYNTPGLLFPAISLLMLAFTNRFFGLASLARHLIQKYRETKDENLVLQIENLSFRISLVRFSQSFGILSLIFCTFSIAFIPILSLFAWCFFGSSLLFMIISLIFSLVEIHLSTKALNVELKTALKENLESVRKV
ncbi:DUF2721 domain-containing protein [Leptospira andrefontaineae]|uniref:DUF2721 domain-containing protein n=1 Tax=Leptospira andrefontaineae TaxID=2484976 RepID=A0A4R9GZ04_9LEPT|nr:DUF2721 domain-containing protein [Leptospira andrefontaineae]TGK36645.1 DUF2721 domain-containing protein [Leptospira andrefontaineae]